MGIETFIRNVWGKYEERWSKRQWQWLRVEGAKLTDACWESKEDEAKVVSGHVNMSRCPVGCGTLLLFTWRAIALLLRVTVMSPFSVLRFDGWINAEYVWNADCEKRQFWGENSFPLPFSHFLPSDWTQAFALRNWQCFSEINVNSLSYVDCSRKSH